MPFVLEAGGPVARRTFDVIDVCEIFKHWHAGRSKNEVAGSLGLARWFAPASLEAVMSANCL